MGYVQGATGNTNTGTTTATFTTPTTSGNLIAVTTSDDSGTTANGMNVTDSRGNTYIKALHQASASTLSMWYAPNITGGSGHVVTATWSDAATGRCTIAVQEHDEIATVDPLDQVAFAGGASTTPSVNSGATTQADEVVIGGLTRAGATTPASLGAGYSNLDTVNVANAGVAQESKEVSATGVQTVTFSLGASRTWIAGVLTFRKASAVEQNRGGDFLPFLMGG